MRKICGCYIVCGKRVFRCLYLCLAFLLSVLLLSGCQAAPAGPDVQPAAQDIQPEPAVVDVQPEPAPGDVPDEPPTAEYPWETMQIEPAPSAEDYFSQTVVYDPLSFVYEPEWLVSDGNYLNGYRLVNDEDGFRLYQNETCIATYYPQRVGLYRMSPGYIYFCTASAIFRADYGGEQVETLYDAGADALSGVYEAEDVLFFAVKSAPGYAIYRLYAPEGKLELLYDGIPAETKGFSLSTPISNNEIVWTYTNPDFLALAEEHWPTYQERFDLSEYDYTSTYFGMIELDFDQYSAVRCYYSAATGQFAQQDYGYIYLAPQRTEENIQKNGVAWWKDE